MLIVPVEVFNSKMASSYSNIYSTLELITSTFTFWNIKVVIVFTLIAWFIWKRMRYVDSLPPGPWGLPVFGCLLFIKGLPHTWYLKKSEQYGDIFSLKLGSQLVVCIGSRKLLKELFNRQDSIGRPHTPLNNVLGGLGIVLSEGLLWKKQSQFLHEKFRNLGVKLWPNQRFEKFILMEIDELLQTLEKSNGEPRDPAIILGRHMHNVICQLIMSFRFEDNDVDFVIFNGRVTRGMKLYGSINYGEYINLYMRIPGKKAVLNEIKRNVKDISKFHRDRFRGRMELRNNIAATHEPADLLDHYLERIEIEEVQGNDASTIFPGIDPESQVVQVMNDLFSAGTETSRTAILWCLIMMLREKEVAEKVRQELNKTLQVGHQVTLAHRTSLPYVEAVIFETLRLVSVVPLGTTHVNTSPWIVGNYTIPAGTHIIPLINRMSVDSEIYPEPHKFKPERFIRDGEFHATETFVQFGVGNRMCLGVQLARMELFLIFANMMNNFEFSIPEGREIPGLVGVLGATHAPVDFDLCFKKLEQ